MEFTNEKLNKMLDKKYHAAQYVNWYSQLSEIRENKLYTNKALDLLQCLDFTTWDKYQENRIMDLKTINRCKDKFCPNCRKFFASKAMNNMEKPNEYLKSLGYKSYMITITVPNIELSLEEPSEAAPKLYDFIRHMNESFTRFNRKLSRNDTKTEKLFSIFAGVKSLEITWKIIDKEKLIYSFHPHFHCIIYSKDVIQKSLRKFIPGPYRKKSNKYIMFSPLDFYIMKIWTWSYHKLKITKNTLKNLPDEWFNTETQMPNYYMCDIRPITTTSEHDDLIEVFKYPFKDLAIDNIKLFETLLIGTKKLRFTQTFGALFKLDIENDDMGKIQELILEIEEVPEPLTVQGLQQLTIEYKEYKKISRFNAHKKLDKILD